MTLTSKKTDQNNGWGLYNSLIIFLILFGLTFVISPKNTFALESGLEIRFAQGERLFSGESRKPGRGHEGSIPFRDLVLQNFSIANTGPREAQIEDIVVEIFAGDQLMQSQKIDLADTVRVLAKIQQFYDLDFKAGVDVAFGGSRIVKDSETLSNDLLLSANEAIIVTDNFFVVKGVPDRLDITALAKNNNGKKIEISNSIRIDNEGAKNDYIFPAETASWYVYSNIDPIGHHRLTQNSEFAFDATIVDGDGFMFKNDGMMWEDWYAYNKKVFAAADGTVVLAVDGTDFPLKPLMRQEGETWRQYFGRLGQRQFGLFLEEGSNAFQVAGGNHLVIEHAKGEFSWYMHLAKDSLNVKVGQKVKQGDHIAGVGGTGENPNVHLHFQVTDGPGVMSQGMPFQFIDHIKPNDVLNTSRPKDPGNFYWLKRDGLPEAN